MAKVAVDSDRRVPTGRRIASGSGWTVSDMVCTAGPADRPFEEQFLVTSVAIVLSGTFQYRTRTGREFMMPGSLLLGNAGDAFTCGHEHSTGDRCVSFSYRPEFFESLASDGAVSATRFITPRVHPARSLSPLFAKTAELLNTADNSGFEAIAIQLALEAIRTATGRQPASTEVEASSLSRVTRVIRRIEAAPDENHNLTALARLAGLSRHHFLRTFVRVTGTTPHQYLLRVRLRRAALLLKTARSSILDVAFGCGFGDISNFNRAFRAEFGVSPRIYRSRP